MIGTRTVKVLSDNKVRVMAIEAESTLMIDKENLLREANEHNVTILAMKQS